MASPMNETFNQSDNGTWELDSFVTTNDTYDLADPPGYVPDPLQLGAEAWAVPLVFSIITLVGVAGNGLVIYVIARDGQMKTVTNYYLLNLAVADLAFLVCCVPFTAIIFATNDWLFGSFMCKFVFYFMQVTFTATGLTLAALSLDRYYAIVHPIGSMYYRTPRTAFFVNTVVWAAAFVLASPVAVAYQQWDGNFQGPRTYCTDKWSDENWRKVYWVSLVVLCFVIPLAVCTFTSAHVFHQLWNKTAVQPLVTSNQHRALVRKRKVCRMVVAVVVIFTLCWAPNHIINLWLLLDDNFPETWVMFGVKVAALCLSYANSSINPVIYAFLGENFRKSFKKAFPKVFHSNRVAPLGTVRAARHAVPARGGTTGAGFLKPPENRVYALTAVGEQGSSKDDHADYKVTKSDQVEVISSAPMNHKAGAI